MAQLEILNPSLAPFVVAMPVVTVASCWQPTAPTGYLLETFSEFQRKVWKSGIKLKKERSGKNKTNTHLVSKNSELPTLAIPFLKIKPILPHKIGDESILQGKSWWSLAISKNSFVDLDAAVSCGEPNGFLYDESK